MRSLRSLLVRSVARMLVASCAVAALSPALLSLPADGGLAMTETAYAQTATPPVANAVSDQNTLKNLDNVTTGAAFANKFIETGNGLIQAAFMLMNPVLMFASWLLSPDWTFGDVFNMRPILHDLWVLVSNIVYVIFAIALLVIAVLNIFGNQTYQIKSVLPKFVGGIIIVPLSWFIVSAILSIANILTASMLNLPYDTFTSNTTLAGNGFIQRIENYTFPNDCTLDFESQAGTSSGQTSSGSTSGKTIDCKWTVALREMFGTEGSPYSILYVYAYGIFRVDTLQEITPLNAINKASDIIFGLFTGLVGFVIMLLLVIGIVFVLLTRVLQLWLFAVLSPLFGLFVFLGENVLGGNDGLGKYNIKEFIKLAMVPVYISAALSFGMMLVLTVATSTVTPDETTGNSYVKMSSDTTAKTETIMIGNNEDEGKRFKLTVKGSPLGLANGVGGVGQIGMGTIGRLIVMILALIVLWLAVVAGSKSSDITQAAIEPIESFGKSVGGTITKLPQYIPIPLGGDKKMSYAGLQSLGTGIASIGDAARSSGSGFGQKIADKIGDVTGIQTNKALRDAQLNIEKNRTKFGQDKQTAGKAMAWLMQTLAQSEQYDSLTEVARDPSARGKIIDGVTVITDNVIKKEEREAIISELRAANTEPKLQAALNRLNDALEGRLNLSGVVDTAGWTMNNSKGAWERLGGGQNNGGPTTPPNPATTHPFAPKNPIPMTGTGVTAETIATGINTQFPADKKTDSAHLAGLKAWIEINVPVAVRDDVIQKLKDAGYDESKLK